MSSDPTASPHPVVRVELPREGPVPELPRYMTDSAAGLDLCACLGSDVTIPPGGRALIPTGIRIALPDGYEGQVRPRSGLAVRYGVTVLNSPGTIDADYRGEISVVLINHGDAEYVVKHSDRIAQLVVAPVSRVELALVQQLDDTQRGEGGFGHTGVGTGAGQRG